MWVTLNGGINIVCCLFLNTLRKQIYYKFTVVSVINDRKKIFLPLPISPPLLSVCVSVCVFYTLISVSTCMWGFCVQGRKLQCEEQCD